MSATHGGGEEDMTPTFWAGGVEQADYQRSAALK